MNMPLQVISIDKSSPDRAAQSIQKGLSSLLKAKDVHPDNLKIGAAQIRQAIQEMPELADKFAKIGASLSAEIKEGNTAQLTQLLTLIDNDELKRHLISEQYSAQKAESRHGWTFMGVISTVLIGCLTLVITVFLGRDRRSMVEKIFGRR